MDMTNFKSANISLKDSEKGYSLPYFDHPMQVKYLDQYGENEEDYRYVGGIAYQDEVICGCCGGIVSIEELYEFAQDYNLPFDKVLHVYDDWLDLESEIRGDE